MQLTKKSKRFIFASIGLVVVLVLISVIVIVTIDTSDEESDSGSAPGEPITIEEYLSSSFSTARFNGSWSEDSEIVWTDQDGNLVQWNVETGQTTTVVSKEIMSLVSNTSTFLAFAPNNKNLLLFYDNRTNIWRHSFFANYVVLDATTNKTIPIEPKGSPAGTRLRHAEWRNLESGSQIIYSHDNNVYLRTNVSDPDSSVELTSDGVVDAIYNGIPDWVYEEEVLSTNTAMHVSEDGKYLAYAQFNDTEVDSFYYTLYGEPSDPSAYQYTNNIKLPYPKAGSKNPSVKVFVKEIDEDLSSSTLEVIPPKEFLDMFSKDYIYFRIYWINSTTLGVVWMNRVQNVAVTSQCEKGTNSWNCRSVHEIEELDGWVILQEPYYNSDGTKFLQILPHNVGGKDYQHLAMVTPTLPPAFLTEGPMVVTQVLTWFGNKVYFVGTRENDPGSRHLYVHDGTSKCITCDLHMANDTTKICEYSDFYLSPNTEYFVQVCKGPVIGEIVVRENRRGYEVVQIISDNAEIKEKLKGKMLPETMRLKVDVSGGFQAPVIMHLPPNRDPSKKYPLIVNVYGGPESQEVDQRWSVDWKDFLVTNYDIVYAAIDGRGTGFQSNDYIYTVNRNLGSVEMEDQIEVTKKLLTQFPYLDPNRVGIWGWSYGGYATLKTMSMDQDNVFKCGISVAPPTDWHFYDTVYTERFMGLPTPEDNLDGYKTSSLLDKVESLRGKNFMINHGVADDNVHFQQSMMLFRALEKADIPFIQNSFPEENHGLGGVKKFLYHTFDSYWTKCFGLESVIKP